MILAYPSAPLAAWKRALGCRCSVPTASPWPWIAPVGATSKQTPLNRMFIGCALIFPGASWRYLQEIGLKRRTTLVAVLVLLLGGGLTLWWNLAGPGDGADREARLQPGELALEGG